MGWVISRPHQGKNLAHVTDHGDNHHLQSGPVEHPVSCDYRWERQTGWGASQAWAQCWGLTGRRALDDGPEEAGAEVR